LEYLRATHISPTGPLRFLLDEESYTWSTCSFYTSFEISKFDVWRSEEYQKWWDWVEKRGGIFYERWSSAAIQSVGLGLSTVKKAEVAFLKGVGFSTEGVTRCAADEAWVQERCGECRASVDWKPSSCLAAWIGYQEKGFYDDLDPAVADESKEAGQAADAELDGDADPVDEEEPGAVKDSKPSKPVAKDSKPVRPAAKPVAKPAKPVGKAVKEPLVGKPAPKDSNPIGKGTQPEDDAEEAEAEERDADEPDADEPDADEPDADEPDADERDADEPDADDAAAPDEELKDEPIAKKVAGKQAAKLNIAVEDLDSPPAAKVGKPPSKVKPPSKPVKKLAADKLGKKPVDEEEQDMI